MNLPHQPAIVKSMTSMKPDTNESRAGGALAQPVRPSPLEQLHAWMMAKKHEYLVEKGSWREAGDTGMQTRAEGKAAAMMEALSQLELMLAMPNARSAGARDNNQPHETKQIEDHKHRAGFGSADAACSALPLPKALYSCKYCADEYSWPPDDLHWFQKVEGWVCENCWDEDDHGEPGIRLDKEIARQNARSAGDRDNSQPHETNAKSIK